MNWCRRLADIWGVWGCSVFMSSLRRENNSKENNGSYFSILNKKNKKKFSVTLLWLVSPVTSLASLVQSIHALRFSVPLNPSYSQLINTSQTRPHTHPHQFTSLTTELIPSSVQFYISFGLIIKFNKSLKIRGKNLTVFSYKGKKKVL